MRVRALIIISFILFTIASWSFFLSGFFILFEENSKLEDSLDYVEAKIDYLSDTSDILWNERIFEKEMRENLAYYLPEGFSSKVSYIGLTPLDLEFSKAKVYFIHRHKMYKVDLSYTFDDKKLKIDRESTVELVQ